MHTTPYTQTTPQMHQTAKRIQIVRNVQPSKGPLFPISFPLSIFIPFYCFPFLGSHQKHKNPAKSSRKSKGGKSKPPSSFSYSGEEEEFTRRFTATGDGRSGEYWRDKLTCITLRANLSLSPISPINPAQITPRPPTPTASPDSRLLVEKIMRSSP